MNVYVEALLNTLMGMGTVFVVLIFMSLLFSLFVYVPNLERAWKQLFAKKEKKTEERPAPKRPILEPEIAEEPEMDEGELIAVITAAIVAASGGAVSADQLVVRSIKRVRRR